MGLPGEAIEKVREALKSAFPNRPKLLMMLRIQLNIEEPDVLDNPDYNLVVFDLIEKLEKQERIPELVKGALREVPGNYDLQNLPEVLIKLIKKYLDKNKADEKLKKIFQEINIIILNNILIPFEKDYIHQMKQAYLACCSDSLREDWEDESPDTLEEILANLKDTPQGKAPESPIIQFLARLSEDAEIPELAARGLKKWGEQNANNFSELLTQIRNAEITRNEQEIVQTYLIVLLNPSKQHQNKRYFVSGWFISDGRNDKFNFRTGAGYTFLDILNKQKSTFNLREISIVIKDFLNQINKYMTDSSSQPIIVFFLPPKLLVNEPIDCWKIGKFPIGTLYQVVLRSCGRIKDYDLRSNWIQKWENLHQQINNLDLNTVIPGDSCDWKNLFVKLSKSNAIALKFVQPPSQEIIDVIDKTAIPVAIWLRRSLKNLNYQDQIDTLFENGIATLPNIVKEKRVEAFPIDDIEQHIGHHLSLLWENPYILPPHIEYTTPS